MGLVPVRERPNLRAGATNAAPARRWQAETARLTSWSSASWSSTRAGSTSPRPAWPSWCWACWRSSRACCRSSRAWEYPSTAPWLSPEWRLRESKAVAGHTCLPVVSFPFAMVPDSAASRAPRVPHQPVRIAPLGLTLDDEDFRHRRELVAETRARDLARPQLRLRSGRGCGSDQRRFASSRV
jgi:hypothetical protein